MVSVTTNRKLKAFTLVELLVVIAIIGILVGLLMPAVMNAQNEARRAQCQENVRNVAMALANFETGKGYFPGYINKFRGQSNPVTWQAMILEQLGNGDLNKQLSTGKLTSTPHLSILNCPSDSRVKCVQSYRINGGLDGSKGTDKTYLCTGLAFDRNADSTLKVGVSQISDGAANTVLIGENSNNRQDWKGNTDPYANCLYYTTDTDWGSKQYAINRNMDSGSGVIIARPSSRHRGIALVAFADTHILSLKDSIQYNTYKLIMCPNDTSTNNSKKTNIDLENVDNNYQ